MGTGDPLIETKYIIEDKNNKYVRTSTRGPLKKKGMLRDKNDKQVCTSTGEPLKKKEIFRDENLKQVRTYADVVSIGKISNEREVSILNKVVECHFLKNNPD